jgi:fibronectin-binding autotransporter adhesin
MKNKSQINELINHQQEGGSYAERSTQAAVMQMHSTLGCSLSKSNHRFTIYQLTNQRFTNRSNIMKTKSISTRTLFRVFVVTIASLSMLAGLFAQNLVLQTGATFSGAGTISVHGNITNSGVAAATAFSGTVALAGAGAQAVGTAAQGAINFSTLNVNSTSATATFAVASAVTTALSVANGTTLAIGANALTLGGTSTLNASGVLSTAAGSTVTYNSGGAGQVVLGGFTYNGAVTLSGGTKTMSSAGLTTVAQAFSHAGGALTISSGGLTLTTTGALAAVNNNGGTITGGSGAATFSGLLTQNGGNLTAGGGGLVLNAGLTNTSGNVTVGSGNSMTVSGGQFSYTAGTLTFDAASTVTYGASATSIVPSTYGTLAINTDAKTFPAGTTNVSTALTASSDMTITGTLALAAAANANIGANFTDNGTFTAPSGAGLVTFNGVTQTIAGSSTPTFKNLTLGGTGAKTANVGINVASGGQLTVDQNLTMSGANVLLMQNGALQPSYAALKEVVGSLSWQAFSAGTYTYNNSATAVTFAGTPGTLTFTINSQPSVNPTGYALGHSVNRKFTHSYANFGSGTADVTLAYLGSEVGGATESKLKDFQNGISSPDKLAGTYTRVGSGASFGSVKLAGLTNAVLVSGNELALDDRFNIFNSIASASWNAGTTWDAGSIPTATDDVVIANSFPVTIPDAFAAAAQSVTISATATGLTVGGGASGTLAVGAGGLTNNSAGTGLTVLGGASVTITGGTLTNAGAITNAGTITVQ